jgi:hypothetical protein
MTSNCTDRFLDMLRCRGQVALYATHVTDPKDPTGTGVLRAKLDVDKVHADRQRSTCDC